MCLKKKKFATVSEWPTIEYCAYISKDSQKLNFFSFFIKNPNSLHAKFITFEFLNKKKSFEDISKINFDYQEFGELWCYNLNYFDFLNLTR